MAKKKATKTSDLIQEAQVAMASDATITLGELSERYIKGLEERGAGPGTALSYSMELRLAQKHLGAATPVGLITADHVRAYFESDPVTKTRAGVLKAKPTIDKSRRVLRLAL
ncbi:MAG: hypothetical protein IT459_23240, partial [Planctomycetes bacterium]|nr:hypothetical protein [Planctomycetota bacterium]